MILTTLRVQTTDYSQISEYVLADRNSFYTITRAFELDPTIKAYQLVSEGKVVKDPLYYYSFGEHIKLPKYNKGEFQW